MIQMDEFCPTISALIIPCEEQNRKIYSNISVSRCFTFGTKTGSEMT